MAMKKVQFSYFQVLFGTPNLLAACLTAVCLLAACLLLNGEAARGAEMASVGEITPAGETTPVGAMLTLENDVLQVKISAGNATFQVLDRRTGRVWKTSAKESAAQVVRSRLNGNEAELELILEGWKEPFLARIALNANEPNALEVELKAEPERSVGRPVCWPPAFCSRPGDRLVMPVNTGFSLPVEEPIPWEKPGKPNSGWRPYYSGHGANMAFWGQTAADGSGLMAFIETPNNSVLDAHHAEPDRAETNGSETDGSEAKAPETLASCRILWGADCRKFGHDRKIRFLFFPDGGHTAMAKYYRKQALAQGTCVPFSEKIRQNPARRERLERLIGAANIWVMSGIFTRLYEDIDGIHPDDDYSRSIQARQMEIYREMRANGMDHLLVSAGTTAENLKELNAMEGVLTSRYDIYQDVMDPKKYELLTAIKPEWPKESYPDDIRRDAGGSLGYGWQVPQKDPAQPMISCVHLCDRQSVPYIRERVAEELRQKPYTARFIDVTACSGWTECYSPDHPMTKTDAREWKGKLLAVPGSEFNLVLGSETGHEAFVPQCDYFEGMMSFVFARVPDAGRNMVKLWDEIPEEVAKFQVNPRYRVPLWELVYHDCVVSYWYWGDASNKLPALMAKRDLFNALYGEPPIYVSSPEGWEQQKESIFRSYQRAEPISRLVGMLPMTDHRVLTDDWLVQQTEFGEKFRVTANFSPEPYLLESGKTVPANEWVLEESGCPEK